MLKILLSTLQGFHPFKMRLIRSDKVVYSAQNRPILPVKKESLKNQDKISFSKSFEVKKKTEIFELSKDLIIKPNLSEILLENEVGVKLGKSVTFTKVKRGDSDGFVTGYNSDNEIISNYLIKNNNDIDDDKYDNDNDNNYSYDSNVNENVIDYNESMTNNNNNNNNKNNNNNYNNDNNNIHNDLPQSLVCMRINNTGGKELTLRSVLSLKNNTNRIFQLSVRRGTDTTEASLGK